MSSAAIGAEYQHDDPSFAHRWFLSTNHKDIGTLYLVFTACAAIFAVGLSIVMRAELMEPGVQFLKDASGRPNGQLYNVLTSVHGLLMMFFVIIPAMFGGFGNYFVPLMIGAPDMAFPRLNNFSFWLFLSGFALLTTSFFIGVAAAHLTSINAEWKLLAALKRNVTACVGSVGVNVTVTGAVVPGVNAGMFTVALVGVPTIVNDCNPVPALT